MTYRPWCVLLASLVLSVVPLAHAEAQVPYRDPDDAKIWAFMIPGGGHFYAGEPARGAALLGTSVTGLVLWVRGTNCRNLGECATGDFKKPLGIILALGGWLVGMVDADDSARRVNERNGWGPDGVRLSVDGGTAVEVAVSVSFR